MNWPSALRRDGLIVLFVQIHKIESNWLSEKVVAFTGVSSQLAHGDAGGYGEHHQLTQSNWRFSRYLLATARAWLQPYYSGCLGHMPDFWKHLGHSFFFNFYKKNSFHALCFDHILFPPLIPNSSQILPVQLMFSPRHTHNITQKYN